MARDATILSVITLVVLVLSGMVGLSTVSLIKSYGYIYVPSSFGKTKIKEPKILTISIRVTTRAFIQLPVIGVLYL